MASFVPKCLCILLFILPVPAAAQTAIFLKAAGSAYGASNEEGYGWGAAISAVAPFKSIYLNAELGATFLSPFATKCTLGIPGECFPKTPPNKVLEAGAGISFRPDEAVELRGSAVLAQRVHDNSSNTGFGVEGAIALVLAGGRMGVEVRDLFLLDSPEGWLASIRLRYRL